MYLKALELQGFKSFPDKTRITFEKDVTAIVGPNGSGKSNISDAILWVMGEQRSKTLRGGKMEDVIFGGTEKRGALGFAQVSLIIDNTEHIFDCDSTELMLTRRYYRSGESEYYINREAVRLKDINSLLMDTGLGRDGYSIIGQGKIAEIVSTKSSDRREVFEEAAGISRYRSRKEESERKLEKTEENLLRINDKIDELELQIEPLRRQSETAKKYLVLRDELRVREISVWMATLDKLHAQAQVINADYETAKSELDEAHRSLEALYASAGSISERMHEKDIEADKARERLSQTEAKAADCDSRAAVLRANIKSSGESVERMKSDIAGAQARLSEIARQIDDNGAKADELAGRIAELSAKETGSSNVIEGCRMKLQSRENAAAQLREKVNRLSVDCRSMDARIHMLSEMEKEYEGFSKAVKTVMRESGRGNLRGVHGPVANLIKTDNEYALAVETALGAAMQNIVIDTQNDAALFDGIEADTLRDRFVVTLEDNSLITQTKEMLKQIDGVDEVSAHDEIANGFQTVQKVLNIAAMVIIVVLFVVSMFIISNTIKLAMYSRSQEIAIMKMVGATNSFIRLPFVVEGLILGFISSLVAFFLEWGLYDFLASKIAQIDTLQLITIVPFAECIEFVAIAYAVTGFVVGVFGSMLSIRKFLRV